MEMGYNEKMFVMPLFALQIRGVFLRQGDGERHLQMAEIMGKVR